jgi:hypothetical protein
VRRLACIIVLVSDPATADEQVTRLGMRGSSRWEHDGPLLHLDASLPANAEGLAGSEDRDERVIELGPRLRVVTATRWWQSGLTPDLPGPPTSHDLEIVARGWRAAAELSYELGPFRVGASAATSHVDSRFEIGTYQDIGLSISKLFHLSRWTHGWLSLGINNRRWSGAPPRGESNGTTLMLSIGATFQ